jgi:sigma-B regulation protein RsbU (phosphoserine phosphatase)
MKLESSFDFKKSARWQITVAYTILALINIIFFSVMIFENQWDLLIKNFKYQSEKIAQEFSEELQATQSGGSPEDPREIMNKLSVSYDMDDYILFQPDGKVILSQNPIDGSMDPEILKRANDYLSESSLFKAKYLSDLREKDFKLTILLELKSKQKTFLYSILNLAGIQARLNHIYFQVFLALVWGLLFHALFGVYLYRLIFRRVGLLEKASQEMAKGNLKTRLNWEFKKNDELDSLGKTFNSMATKIEDTVFTISKLNNEINQELKIGKEVQELFLPSKKILKKFNTGIFYCSMREVGGDIYNFYKVKLREEEYTGFFLVDASGHGVSAALVTVVIALSLENLLAETKSPHRLLTKLGFTIANRLQSSFFATGVLGLIDSKGKLRISNAGHPTPYLIQSKTGIFKEIASSGPPLGISEDHHYKSEVLNPGDFDKLLIYTDGVTECKSPSEEEFGKQRLVELVKNNLDKSNQEIVNLVSEQLRNFSDEFRDDVSILLMDIKPS